MCADRIVDVMQRFAHVALDTNMVLLLQPNRIRLIVTVDQMVEHCKYSVKRSQNIKKMTKIQTQLISENETSNIPFQFVK